jgi:multidrug efflux pump subunit AcrA (membrane-fusion protein)
MIATVVFVAFLPYPFRVGGEFIIQPLERSEVRARTDGEVLKLLVEEGDWVTKGQVMARLSNWNQKRDIGIREADVAKGRAELATLVAGPRPEEVKLATQRVIAAGVSVEYANRELDRKRELFSRGAGSEKEIDLAEGRYLEKVSEQEVARAALELVQATALESEIAVAEAVIERDTRDLEFKRLQLEYANIRAVADGQIVTPLQKFSVGTFLPIGGLFAKLEDNRTVFAEIEIPETEIEEVAIGAEVEIKLWSAPWDSVYGTVQRVAPKAEEREFGRIIRVLVEVPNPDGLLATNMTGHGKIAAKERPVWEAFTRAFVRFFKVELWSWLP